MSVQLVCPTNLSWQQGAFEQRHMVGSDPGDRILMIRSAGGTTAHWKMQHEEARRDHGGSRAGQWLHDWKWVRSESHPARALLMR